MTSLRAVAVTHLGNVRERNEDRCGVREEEGIAFVADGVGGHPAGHIASQIAAETLAGVNGSALDASIVTRIQENMRTHLADHPEHAGLSTTLDAVQLDGDTLRLVHIGDSRIYQFANDTLMPLTEDHSYVGDLVRAGMLTRENARVHPLSNLITRYIGADTHFEADFHTIRVEPGTRLLLATDGLTDMVAEADLQRIIASIDNREELAGELIRVALDAGGRDNISLVLADVL